MKIGVVGPSDSLDRIFDFLSDRPDEIEIIRYEALSLNDAIEVADACQHDVDGILYSGQAVSGAVTSKRNIQVPQTYIAHSAFGILSLIYNQIKASSQRISFDFVSEKVLSEIPINLKEYTIKTLPYQVYYDESDYIAFHEESMENETDIVVTSFTSVYQHFKAKQMPVYRLHTLKFDVRHSLNLLVKEIEKKHMADAQISVQTLKCSLNQTLEKYDYEHARLSFEQVLNDYARECSGTVVRRDANLYYLYSTNRILKSERTLQAFFEMISDTQIDVFSGIATAYTVFQAELTAEQALQRALQEKHSNVCLLNEVGQIKGPFFEYSTTLNEPSLKTGLAKSIARKTNLSEAYIQRIYRMMKNKNVNRFTAKEFAHYLNISDRSANRIFKKLIDGDYAKVVDTIMVNKSGRPFKVVQITIDNK